VRWIVSPAETAPLDGPYALVTAGAAMHWMRWPELFGRLAPAMADGAVLAVGGHGHEDPPGLVDVIVRYSRSPDYDPDFRLVDALTEAGLFEPAGSASTEPVAFRQRVEDYVEYLHSTSSLAREWMSADEAAAFDREVTAAVAPYATDGWLDLPVTARFDWGRVLAG